MFYINFIKAQPTTYVLHYRNGRLIREGAGLSFYYFSPTSSLVSVPLASADMPFIFAEVTSDFQEVTVQGQVTYRVADAKQLAGMLNFTLAADGRNYVSDDPEKLPLRVINQVQVLTREELKTLPLKQAVKASDELAVRIRSRLASSEFLNSMGIEILDLSILAIKPNPETARALEADMREHLLREADEAIYSRRNSAVEQERAIRENELNTEIAVENKKRQIRETQMDAERAVQEKARMLQEDKMEAKIALEQKNKELVDLVAGNAQKEADARAYAISAVMKAFSATDPQALQYLAGAGMNPEQLIALSFTEIAKNAQKIGELNLSPDLLRVLMRKDKNG
jgi:regulator of protease activity HflC (stomatin/prohibitin superfamily)